jgi:hypothetical protein
VRSYTFVRDVDGGVGPTPIRPMSAGTDDGAATKQICVRCGDHVSQATSYLTEVGVLCWPCFGRFQTEQQLAERRDADLQGSLTRRAKLLAGVHWVMWAALVLIAAGHPFPEWGRASLLVVIAGLGIGLFLRLRWAYEAALVLDAAGVLGLAALAVVQRQALMLFVEVFPAALLALTWALRSAYPLPLPLSGSGGTLGTTPPIRARRHRWLVPAAALVAVAGGGAAVYLLRRPGPLPDPALTLMRTTLPEWQLARARPFSHPSGPTGALVGGARRWPALAAAFEALDRDWPEETSVRAAAASVNRALADAGMPYFASVWMVNDQPYVLSHLLVARVPWHIGARAIDVLRLRRLDDIGIDFAFRRRDPG